MYNQIFQLRELGFSKSKIAKKLGVARGTVIDYLERNPEEMALWLASTKRRTRKLDQYKGEILGWLREHPDLSSAQIADWLEERYPKFEVGESTVRRYVREIRKEFNIPKITHKRLDRKSTRLNSSHVSISYAVFCLKTKMSGEEEWMQLTASVRLTA